MDKTSTTVYLLNGVMLWQCAILLATFCFLLTSFQITKTYLLCVSCHAGVYSRD